MPVRWPPPGHSSVLPTAQPQPWRREQGSPLWCTPALLGKRNLWKGFPESKTPPTPATLLPCPRQHRVLRGALVLGLGQVPCHLPATTERHGGRLAKTSRELLAARPVSLSPSPETEVAQDTTSSAPVRPKPSNSNCGGKEPLERKK